MSVSADDSLGNGDLMDRIVLIVCAILVVLLLIALIAICLVYRSKRHRLLNKQLYKTTFLPQTNRNFTL